MTPAETKAAIEACEGITEVVEVKEAGINAFLVKVKVDGARGHFLDVTARAQAALPAGMTIAWSRA